MAYQEQRHEELQALDAMRRRQIPELLEHGLSFAEIADRVYMNVGSVAQWCVRELGMEIDYRRMKIEHERQREYEKRVAQRRQAAEAAPLGD